MDLASRLHLLDHTRVSTVVAAASTAHWMFGNLYEEIVLMPPSLVHPQPGALVGPWDAGSPVWYYGPTLPVAVISSWVAAARASGDPEAGRRTRRAAAAVSLAAALKIALIVRVNPDFRDPEVSSDTVRSRTKVWLLGNGITVAALAAALTELVTWRRHPRGSFPEPHSGM